MVKYRLLIPKTLLLLSLLPTLSSTALADQKSDWLRRWNNEAGNAVQYKAEDVILKESRAERMPSLFAAGFRQSDSGFTLGRVIWKQQSYTPLSGFAAVLQDFDFANLSDGERRELFLELLQQTYGAVGIKPYTGSASKRKDRPWPIVDLRGPDDSHRFQVWYFDMPIDKEEGEWREVVYVVSPDGSKVKARTLGSYYPGSEKLRGFPRPTSELFE